MEEIDGRVGLKLAGALCRGRVPHIKNLEGGG